MFPQKNTNENNRENRYHPGPESTFEEKQTYNLFVQPGQIHPFVVSLELFNIKFNSENCFLVVLKNISSTIVAEQTQAIQEVQELITKSISKKIV